MSMLTNDELDKLTVMYEGDAARDAADKIRGFLFQDYVTIMRFFEPDVEAVFLEYLEDVAVCYTDGRFEITQVKYYPRSSWKKNEVSTDLYYTFLRTEMLKSSLNVIPCIYIKPNGEIKKPTAEYIENCIKKLIKTDRDLIKSVDYSAKTKGDPETWLKTEVYKESKKDEQKKILFSKMASKDSVERFSDKLKLEIIDKDISEFKESVMDKLISEYSTPISNKEIEKAVLLGYAIMFIHRRYMNEQACPKIEKQEFDKYMNSYTGKYDNAITGYLIECVQDKYNNIVSRNKFDDFQNHMIRQIYENTIQWISEITKDEDGQYQLLYTISTKELYRIAEYKNKKPFEKLLSMAECSSAFGTLLGYLWKIMLNICQEHIKNINEILGNEKLFDPTYYINDSVKEYVCFNFPEDWYSDMTVILPPAADDFDGVKRKVIERVIKLSQKPQKWFYKNNDIIRGKNFYEYSTANVIENPTVVDLGEKSFYIECMDCIRCGERDWDKPDACGKCIFSEKCQQEGKN